MDEFDYEAEYSLNLDGIIATRDNFFLAGELAFLLKKQGLMSIGECMKSFNTSQLYKFVDHIEDTFGEEDPSENTCHEELFLIGLMFSVAEGESLQMSEDMYVDRMQNTMTLIMMESLHRKGLIELTHTNISFDEACKDRPVARATQRGIDWKEQHDGNA